MNGRSSAMNEIITYIIEFLLYGDKEAAKWVGYTADPTEAKNYKIVITPNGHLGKDIILPDLNSPLSQTDIIYNTFFFLSRAEELINLQRDEHGRFAARYSILGQHNRLQIPLVDEYSRFLLKALDLPIPPNTFSQITLTHDIDTIAYYRHLRGAIGGVLRHSAQDVWASWQDIHNDPAYTFPWLIQQDRKVPYAQVIYFVKHTHGRGYDYPQYNLNGKDWEYTQQLLLQSGATLGTHTSYYGYQGGTNPVRSHYLNCSIDTLRSLVKAGITDDYSMGFADQAGFRLQTTRPVRWIDPQSYTLTPLTLHPLTVMDCTLSNANYMNLSEDEAYFFCQRLFDKVRQNNGELVLLWHNSIFTPDTYHKRLYHNLLNLL